MDLRSIAIRCTSLEQGKKIVEFFRVHNINTSFKGDSVNAYYWYNPRADKLEATVDLPLNRTIIDEVPKIENYSKIEDYMFARWISTDDEGELAKRDGEWWKSKYEYFKERVLTNLYINGSVSNTYRYLFED